MAREPRGAVQERARAGHRVTWESERTVTERLRDCDTKRAPPPPPPPRSMTRSVILAPE